MEDMLSLDTNEINSSVELIKTLPKNKFNSTQSTFEYVFDANEASIKDSLQQREQTKYELIICMLSIIIIIGMFVLDNQIIHLLSEPLSTWLYALLWVAITSIAVWYLILTQKHKNNIKKRITLRLCLKFYSSQKDITLKRSFEFVQLFIVSEDTGNKIVEKIKSELDALT